ncbi:FtsW/RodA/SpoVE family cell cycle protein [Paenibacillus terreus]|uniref:FtsW/RodA/SpoVE family cell cycle protein n=1 Tax=Paenibacillus terreus TaxID=1387834 RepID=A0ABV5BGJ0_9BACL
MKKLHPLLQQYVDHVSGQVKARELREDIKEEIAGHLEGLMEHKLAQGLDDDAAAQWAIAQMGSTESVAKGLNQVHRPRIPWGMLSYLILLLAVALVSMYAIDLSYAAISSSMAEISFLEKQAVFMAIGLVVLFVLSRLQYRLLLHMWKVLYGGTIVCLIVGIYSGSRLNGTHSFFNLGPLSVNFLEVSLFTFIVSAAGFLYQRNESWKAVFYHLVMFSAVPLILYTSAHSFATVLQYVISYLLLLIFSRCSLKWMIPHMLFSICALIFFSFSEYGRERLAAFLFPFKDQEGTGFFYIQIGEAVRSAGWWGHGFASVAGKLPYIYSNNVFTYIIYSLGWLAGAAILLIVIMFIYQLIRVALSVQDSYGKMLIIGLGALFSFKFTYSIGMSLGLLPLTSVMLPFISYGGIGLLVQLAALGIIYSVYRRKDMVRVERNY